MGVSVSSLKLGQELGTRFGHSSEHPRAGGDSVTGSLFCFDFTSVCPSHMQWQACLSEPPPLFIGVQC